MNKEAEMILNENILELKALKVYFALKRFGFQHAGFVHAVDGVDLNLKRGQTIAIVGESGSGKTSLMRTILHLNTPTEGEVIFDGQVINNLKSNELKAFRHKTGYVQQDPYGAMPPFMNVQTILEEPLKISGVKDKTERLRRVIQVLKRSR